MRLVIARFNHETNTFSPVPTPLAAFEPRWGSEAHAAALGSATAMGAFLSFAQARGAEVVTPVFATANPSGPVADEAFAAISDAIVEAVATGCDAILLDLHGAMVTQSHVDGEGDLLARLRALAPDIPLGVALDLHGNITPLMIANCDICVGFKTYPHVDMAETGAHVARLIGRMLDEGLKPHQAWCHPPQLAGTLRMNTGAPGAMQELIALARQGETRPGILAASIFGGFPLADIPNAGASAVIVAESREQAAGLAEELGLALWERRQALHYDEAPLPQSVRQAREAAGLPGDQPVVLLDHGDNCMSGGTCDTMHVFEEALRQQLEGIVVGPISDPEAVAVLTAAGAGAEITVAVGNRLSSPVAGAKAEPLVLKGVVSNLGNGEYTITGPTYTGMQCSMGRTAVLDIGPARILIAERPHEPWDKGVFTASGIDPEDCRFLILKSRMYCRPVFEPLAKAVVECASPGVTSSNYGLFRFEKIGRPVYPLDKDARWSDRTGI